MALEYKSPSEISDEYLTNLKVLKPEVNTDQQDSDWWVRSRVHGGVMSGVYADQTKVAGDIFPQSSRTEAVDRHLETYGIGPRRSAQESSGEVAVTGTIGTIYSVGTQFLHDPTGNTYEATDTVTLTATTGIVPVESVSTGQSQNLLEGTTLTLPSPPAGSTSEAEVLSPGLGDGRDEETNEEAAARVLERIQSPIAGGTESDYKQWAIEADASVTDAIVVRFAFGPGTVAVYITAGTTDIDTAIDEDQAIVRVPSQDTIDMVQDYVDAKNPLTDCAYVFGVNEIEQDVVLDVTLVDGIELTTVLSGQTLTVQELLEREVKRALYKVPVGGRRIGASGFVLASEIEENIDLKLSASPYSEGEIAQILRDRQVQDLSATGVNRRILDNEIIIPGSIVIQEV